MIVEFYKNESGEKPAGEFIRSIEDLKLRAKVIRSIKLLESYGRELTKPDVAPLGDGIYELRTIQSNNIARCLYFFFDEGRAVVTNGFIKKTQKTPPEEIKIARERREDYNRRNKK